MKKKNLTQNQIIIKKNIANEILLTGHREEVPDKRGDKYQNKPQYLLHWFPPALQQN